MLSAAKHLCAHRERTFAEFTLSEANVLRVTIPSRSYLSKFIIGDLLLVDSNTHTAGSTLNHLFSALNVNDIEVLHLYLSDFAQLVAGD
jgi:hypothetical protein